MFTGFDQNVPVYEVITPQSGESFTVKSLSVQSEEAMKGSILTTTKIIEHINKCIFESLIKKPDSIKNYTDYLKKVTLKDREALLYGLFHISYGEIRNYETTCSSCGKKSDVKVNISDTFSIKPYPKDRNILKDTVSFNLEVYDSVEVSLKQPTLFLEESEVKRNMINIDDKINIVSRALPIVDFKYSKEGKEIVLTDREDIIDAFLSLPPKDRKLISKKYQDSFGQYGIELNMATSCQKCGNQDIIQIDLFENFFRSIVE